MNEERLHILQLVSEGKVSPDEAGKLLEAIEPTDRPYPPLPPAAPLAPVAPLGVRGVSAVPHHYGVSVMAVGPAPHAQRLRVVVRSDSGDEFTVAWPLGMLKTVSRMVPEWAQEMLNECGVDLQVLAEANLGEHEVSDEDLLSIHREDGGEVKIRLE